MKCSIVVVLALAASALLAADGVAARSLLSRRRHLSPQLEVAAGTQVAEPLVAVRLPSSIRTGTVVVTSTPISDVPITGTPDDETTTPSVAGPTTSSTPMTPTTSTPSVPPTSTASSTKRATKKRRAMTKKPQLTDGRRSVHNGAAPRADESTPTSTPSFTSTLKEHTGSKSVAGRRRRPLCGKPAPSSSSTAAPTTAVATAAGPVVVVETSTAMPPTPVST